MDLAVESDDDDLRPSDLDDCGDVSVGLVLGDSDALSEQLDAPVRSDVANDLDPAPCRQPRRWPVGGRERIGEPALPDLVGAGTTVGRVAVRDVVQPHEDVRPNVTAISSALSPARRRPPLDAALPRTSQPPRSNDETRRQA